MDTDLALEILGNGDKEKGKRVLYAIAKRLKHARGKHSWENISPMSAYKAIDGEMGELGAEVLRKEKIIERQSDECLDVLATATRFYNREFEA